jgi:hypothetical protein
MGSGCCINDAKQKDNDKGNNQIIKTKTKKLFKKKSSVALVGCLW